MQSRRRNWRPATGALGPDKTASRNLLLMAERERRKATADSDQIRNLSLLSPIASQQANRLQLSFIDVNAKLKAKLEASNRRAGSRQDSVAKSVVDGGARTLRSDSRRRPKTQPVVVVTNSQPTTKSTYAELYRCKRKAESEIGGQQPAHWIQTRQRRKICCRCQSMNTVNSTRKAMSVMRILVSVL